MCLEWCKKWFKRNRGFEEEDLRCPRCNVVMKKVRKQDVIIDVCKKCGGIWLDDKEIDKLVEYAQKHLANAGAAEAKNLKTGRASKKKSKGDNHEERH